MFLRRPEIGYSGGLKSKSIAPPVDQAFELLCEDHVGTYVIPFLCRWRIGTWHSVDTNRPIES